MLDTNTVVSGLLWNSAPKRLIDAAFARRIKIFTSPALLLELEDVLRRSKFAKKVAASGFSAPQLIVRYAVPAQSVMVPASVPRTVLSDPDDDQALTCALTAGADLIVSGDHLVIPYAYGQSFRKA
ncbi:MAG: putative toxin-antitoxin system toxin component, PIN family [Methylococcales bacterium]